MTAWTAWVWGSHDSVVRVGVGRLCARRHPSTSNEHVVKRALGFAALPMFCFEILDSLQLRTCWARASG
eukprot:118093-Chlamydomonas_euryale.AAC.1